jgi:hypothetical protein
MNAAEMGNRRKPAVSPFQAFSALASLEAALGLIDDVDAALTAHDAVVAMAAAQGLQ